MNFPSFDLKEIRKAELIKKGSRKEQTGTEQQKKMDGKTEAVAAPVLSTAQDEENAFAKVQGLSGEVLREKRQHLGPRYTEQEHMSSSEVNDLIEEYYSLENLARFLNQRDGVTGELKYKVIPLQFPDELVCDSAIVAQILQNKLDIWNKEYHDMRHKEKEGAVEGEVDFTVAAPVGSGAQNMSRDIESVEKTIDSKTCGGNCGSKCKNKDKFHQEVWVLADTSYSPCCIDETAAGHVNGDIVVHFGDACLNPVEKIQSCYVFGRPYVEIEGLIETFKSCYEDRTQKVVLMADTPHSYLLPLLYDRLHNEDGYENLVVANVDYEKAGRNATIIDGYETPAPNEGTTRIRCVNRTLSGIPQPDIDAYLETIDPEEENFEESAKFDGLTQEYSLFHITRPHDARLLQLGTKFSDLKVVDPKDVQLVHDQFPTMMRRYRSMQVARTASTVGVLVNTLSLANTRVLLNHVTKSIVEAGKKHYMFVVGKPNVAKLANFECVDVWCVLGCGQSGIIIDMFGDYFKPIITPYELKLALMPQVTWTGKWVTDFDAMLEQDELDREKEEEKENAQEAVGDGKNNDDDDYAPTFDPVSGKLRMAQPLRQLRHLELELEMDGGHGKASSADDDESGLVKRFSGTLAVGQTVSTSALGLQGRQWTGLGSDFAADDSVSAEGARVEEGRTGIARGYV